MGKKQQSLPFQALFETKGQGRVGGAKPALHQPSARLLFQKITEVTDFINAGTGVIMGKTVQPQDVMNLFPVPTDQSMPQRIPKQPIGTEGEYWARLQKEAVGGFLLTITDERPPTLERHQDFNRFILETIQLVAKTEPYN